MLWRTADGRTLEGWVGGDPDGPLVAVLHGCPDTRHVAMTGDAAAREVGVRLLSVNRPGYGRSTAHPSTHGSVADDLAGVATELGHDRFAVLAMSVGGAYAVATAARYPDRVTALGLVATQPPGSQPEEAAELVAELAPEFLAWRASVDPDDPEDERLTERWLAMLPAADAALVAARGPAAVAASVREALLQPDGYLRDAALLHRPWVHAPSEVRCPVRAWFGEDDDRSQAAAAADLLQPPRHPRRALAGRARRAPRVLTPDPQPGRVAIRRSGPPLRHTSDAGGPPQARTTLWWSGDTSPRLDEWTTRSRPAP